jgi:hypothetical protein
VARSRKAELRFSANPLSAPRTLSSCVLWPGPARHRCRVKPHRTVEPDRDEVRGGPYALARLGDAIDDVAALGALVARTDLPDPLCSLNHDAFALLELAKKPRTVWACHPVASAIWATVAPSGGRSMASTCCCLVPSRGLRGPIVRAAGACFTKIVRTAAKASGSSARLPISSPVSASRTGRATRTD